MKRLKLAAILTALTVHAYADGLPPAESAVIAPAKNTTTINGKISSLGLGIEAVSPMTSNIDARFGLNYFKYNFKKSTAASPGVVGTNYEGNFDLQSLHTFADWHPWDGSFRVTGGLIYNNNKFKMKATPDSTNFIWIGGRQVSFSSVVGTEAYAASSVDFRKIAPYLGIGWGKSAKGTGLTFTSDIGILFQGTPNSILTTNITGVTEADKAKANADLSESLKNFNLYPVISIGLGYSF
jgi:hypothetical protein